MEKHILINSYVYSNKLPVSNVFKPIPDDFEQNVFELCCEFLWGQTNWRVARKTITLKKEHGGIELPDFCALIKTNYVATNNHNEIL